jgi:hypothetical protein
MTINIPLQRWLWSTTSTGALALVMTVEAMALTPLLTPQQRAEQDELLARASQTIKPKVMQCFKLPETGKRVPVTVQFLLSVSGRHVSQFVVLERREGSRAMERAAIRAIKACVPYPVLEALREEGGFTVTIAFR